MIHALRDRAKRVMSERWGLVYKVQPVSFFTFFSTTYYTLRRSSMDLDEL